ncbi:hypothetical protein [Ligilactobacillus salivarius]|uniref:Uncharacterized protein n=1 Tax=Ligilactobacillus salivarius (strain UCC118) TaxID=362948 RepID=A0JQA6_LIGS1|nr:hypothetical protein [Ligilactobacillus salivarius]ABD99056.1 Hypothetical protein, phage associated [Ligilactobacillus salivarius UCC118]OQR21905.1 hypothetical protein B6U40_01310 [Ligilactobacillus salivarius]
MRRYFHSLHNFMLFCLGTLFTLSIIDGFLSAFLPNSPAIIFFDKFLSTGISPLLIFCFGVAIGEIDKKDKFK